MRLVALLSVLLCGCNIVFGVEQGLPHPVDDDETTPVTTTKKMGAPIFISQPEIVAVQAHVDAADEPWASAYVELVEDAEIALGRQPVSVIDDNGARAFETISQTTSCINPPDDNRHDYCAALSMAWSARDLGLMYQLGGDDSHAEKAVELLHHFLVDDTTSVLPAVSNEGSGSRIEISLFVAPFAYAASLVRDHPHWGTLSGGQAGLDDWFSSWLTLAKADRPSATSQALYHIAAVAAAEALLEQTSGIDAALADWKATMMTVIAADGTVESSGVGNAFFHIKAITLTAQLSTYYGDNMFDWSDGMLSLRSVYDQYAGSNANLDPVELAEGASMWELAHTQYGDASLKQLIDVHTRPIWDIRVLGWTTLTHGSP